MQQPERSALESAIKSYTDPYFQQNLLDMGAIEALDVEDGQVAVRICLPYPAKGLVGAMRQLLTTALDDVAGVTGVTVHVRWQISPRQAQRGIAPVQGVRNVIAVASAKGGVGKSTVAANLALALAREGARVGILDADIYGPSMGMMLGVAPDVQPETEDDKWFIPLEAHGVQVLSMAFLVNDKTPMIWRGPMVSGALQQLIGQTRWDNLDFLIVDLPPGTGDIQLTLAQKVPVAGAVVVTTPQDIALLDCSKGIEMFRKMDIEVLGVVENMSVHICSHCGHRETVFGEGGGEMIADSYGTDLLGAIPLHRTIREQMDAGTPTVVAEPESEVGLVYLDIARRMAAELARRPQAEGVSADIIATDG